MITSGINTKTIEVVKDIQITMSPDEMYKLRDSLETVTTIPFHFYKALHAVIARFEDEFPDEVPPNMYPQKSTTAPVAR